MVAAPLSCVLNHRFRAKHARGEAPSPTARSRRRDGGARAVAPLRHARSQGRLHVQTQQRPRSHADGRGAALVLPQPQVSREARAGGGAVSDRSLSAPRRRSTHHRIATSRTGNKPTTTPSSPLSELVRSWRRSRRSSTTRFAKHAVGRRLHVCARGAAAQKDPQPHCGVEYHNYADYKPSSTPNGAGAAEYAGLEHKIKALTTVTGAPAPT